MSLPTAAKTNYLTLTTGFKMQTKEADLTRISLSSFVDSYYDTLVDMGVVIETEKSVAKSETSEEVQKEVEDIADQLATLNNRMVGLLEKYTEFDAGAFSGQDCKEFYYQLDPNESILCELAVFQTVIGFIDS